MQQAQKDYKHLHALSKHAQILTGIGSLLHWDQDTYMPKGAAGFRAEQLKTLAGIVHKERTSKEFSKALNSLIDIKTGSIKQKGLSAFQKAALTQWRRDFLLETALPQTFVEEFAKLSSASIFAWEDAKKNNDFKVFLPFLEKILAMVRKKADFIGYKEHPYDALIDQFEPKMTTREVKELFEALKKAVLRVLQMIGSKKQVNDTFLHAKYSVDRQESFNRILLEILGYPQTNGRLDLSVHPFSSTIHPTDSRITTRIMPNLLISNIRSVMHEFGHAFYDMAFKPEDYGSPLGEAISLGMHESQSRWWETRIGLSKPFWKHCLPLLKQHFKGKVADVSLDTFWRAINKVEPSLIRIESDEVTYTLHIILRYELEVALVEGELKAKDIPDAWNAKMKELLGIQPKNNAEGCLQDIHWSMGAFGYFPTYALGNLYAAQFFETFEKELPEWEKCVSQGDLQGIKDWLRRNIHHYGRVYSSKELVKKVTKKPFSITPFATYLEEKYANIYGYTT